MEELGIEITPLAQSTWEGERQRRRARWEAAQAPRRLLVRCKGRAAPAPASPRRLSSETSLTKVPQGRPAARAFLFPEAPSTWLPWHLPAASGWGRREGAASQGEATAGGGGREGWQGPGLWSGWRPTTSLGDGAYACLEAASPVPSNRRRFPGFFKKNN